MGRAWVVSGVLLCACGGGGAKATASEPAPIENKRVEPLPAQTSQVESVMKTAERFTQDMCACAPRDAECGRRVMDEMTAWARKVEGEMKEPKLTVEQEKRMEQIANRLSECMEQAMPSPPPPP